jgi:hypothetical protein
VTLWIVASFVAGVVVGIMVRDAFILALTGHTGVMRNPLPALRSSAGRNAGVVIVVVALIGSGLSGFLNIQNGRDDRDRSLCNSRYNELNGKARDERDAVAEARTDSELALWRDLRDQIRSGAATGKSLDVSMSKHIAALEATKRVRIENPYPPYDMCSPSRR